MENNLYFIENQGCDDTTRGLAMINDDDFPKFKTFIENLNKCSSYGCMPVIFVYKISMDDLKEIVYDPHIKYGDDGYIDKNDVFYLNDKTYMFVDEYLPWSGKMECVISGR